MHLRIAALFVVVAIVGCAAPSAESASWTRHDVVNHFFNLRSDTAVEQYWFGENGNVAVTMGSVGGPIAGPEYEWKIETGRLIIFDSNHVYISLALLKKEGDLVTTQDTGGNVLIYSDTVR